MEEGTLWANKAELYIGLIKELVRKDIKESDYPIAFWDYCVERCVRINNTTAKIIFQLHGYNGHTQLTGDEGENFNLCRFKWYDWCCFCNINQEFSLNKENLGQMFGIMRGAEAKWRTGS